ncbi:MAG: hypothetical protein HDT39_05460 [Lachnospiraceae bacterium]|nr:hypothetical protein [Lachnospiraceae bacterium]
MRRILKKIILTGGIILLGVLIIYVITNKPSIIEKIELTVIHDFPGNEILKQHEEEEMNRILSGDTDGEVVRLENGLPEEWEEGKIVCMTIGVTMRNLTVMPLNNMEATIKEKSEDSYILYTWGDVVTQRQPPFSKKKITIMWFDMFCGDMSYDEIRDYVSKCTAVVRYTMPLFGTHTMEIPLKDIEITKIIEMD